MRRQLHRGLVAALLSCFVWPGAGQLYNREFKKGAALIVLSLLLAVGVIVSTAAELTRRIPSDIENVDPELVRALPADLLAAPPWTLLLPSFLLLAVWAYGIVDAYAGGRGRRKLSLPGEARTPPSSPPTP
jgi:hypothetical protein